MELIMIVQFAVVLGAIWLGARAGGLGLGLWGGVGVFVLVVLFREQPTSPPIDVMLIIMAVIAAAAAMQAAGGIDYLVGVAERIIRRFPKQITIVAPVVSYLFTFGAGTGHVFYPLLPVIHDVALKNGIRPERPIAVSTIASQQAITASPVSAAMAALIAILEPAGMTMLTIMAIALPATMVGTLVAAFLSVRRGVELEDDPIYQQRLKEGAVERPDQVGEFAASTSAPAAVAASGGSKLSASVDEHRGTATAMGDLPKSARRSALMFLVGVVSIVLIGAFENLRPMWDDERLSMALSIQITMLTVGALIILVNKVKVAEVPQMPVAQAGFVALVGIFGLAWLGDTFVAANQDTIIGGLSDMATAYPWTFAIGLFFTSVLLFSQAATTRALMPLGLALGIGGPQLAAMWPAVNGYFFLPTYGTIIAAINFDRTGTTRIGKFVLNHSFMMPGLVAVVVSVSVGLLIASFF